MKPAKTLDELEANVNALRELEEMHARVSTYRRLLLKLPAPRSTCPGCFSAIYEGAAKQGWCTDCYPLRASYERHP